MDFTFYQGRMPLTDIMLRVHHHSWPFQLQTSSFPPFKIEERFRVQNDGALKGNFAARRIHHECDPACHPHSVSSVFPGDCSPPGSQLVGGKTWLVYKWTWWGKPLFLRSWCQGGDFQFFFFFFFLWPRFSFILVHYPLFIIVLRNTQHTTCCSLKGQQLGESLWFCGQRELMPLLINRSREFWLGEMVSVFRCDRQTIATHIS